MTPPPRSDAVTQTLPALLAPVLDTLAQKPSALITDIDGTLSRIVPRPEDASVSDRAREALRRLSHRLDFVAVITAREESVARRLVGLDDITYVGNYAAIRRDSPDGGLSAARELVPVVLARYPGVTFEEKGISFALHYRNCEDPDAVRIGLLEMMTPAAQAAVGRIVEGKRVIEIVPVNLPDKGTALSALAQSNGLNGIVFLGDDLSDVAVFRELARRRERGFAGTAVAVIDAETDDAVERAADLALAGVDQVEDFLERLADALDDEGGVA